MPRIRASLGGCAVACLSFGLLHACSSARPPAADMDAPDTSTTSDGSPDDARSPDGALRDADAGGLDVVIPPDPADAGPPFTYVVTITDPSSELAAAHPSMTGCMEAALDEWGRYLSGAGPLSVEIAVASTGNGRMGGGSVTSTSVGACQRIPAPCNLVEEQAGTRLRTGQSNSPSLPDVRVTVPPPYWNTEVWADPTPKARTAPVPNNRLDCVSLFVHEVGHALGFNGRRSLVDFSPATNGFSSQFDDLVRVQSGLPTFEGPKTLARFGPIPITHTSTSQNLTHYGDPSEVSPFDEGVMNGIVFRYGKRYFVGFLDISILEDLKVPIRAYPKTP